MSSYEDTDFVKIVPVSSYEDIVFCKNYLLYKDEILVLYLLGPTHPRKQGEIKNAH